MPKKRMRWGGAWNIQPSEGSSGGAGIVAFDFDGTITVEDSFTRFLKWRTTPQRHAQGMIRLIPAAVAYLGHRSRGRIKAAAVKEFLAGLPREQLEAEARAFAEAEAVKLLRPDALRSWRWWRGRGAKLVIVSASPDVVVAPFARGLGADALIATELAYGRPGSGDRRIRRGELSRTGKGAPAAGDVRAERAPEGRLWRHRRRS